MKRHRQMTCADGYKKPKKGGRQQLVGRPRREWRPGPLAMTAKRLRDEKGVYVYVKHEHVMVSVARVIAHPVKA